MQQHTDEFYMQRCIDLAKKGKGYVAPNPMVGAVIVHENEIIGEGYHQAYGQAHAEVNAVNAVEDKALLNASTIYVSLEPCAHFGKTPPCADLLVRHQFKRVVIGCVDTFSEVAGKGIERLQQAGISVTIGVLEAECRELNIRFFTFHEQKRPYIILKWAESSDGFMDRDRSNSETGINWITAPDTKKLVHQWRAQEVAILVGKRTALIDNPSLTVREVVGPNPIRLLIDPQLEVETNFSIFSEEAPTLIFNKKYSKKEAKHEWIQLDEISPSLLLKELHKRNIQSVIVEGGAATLQAFIDADLWDEARILIGKAQFSSGLKAPKIQHTAYEEFSFGVDTVRIFHHK